MSSSASSSIRRLPFRQALTSLKSGPGAVTLSSNVSAIKLRFVAKNSEAGPRQFLRNYAPKLAYANPSLPIQIERIRDPRSKHRNPKSPDAGAVWENGEQPKPEMIVSFHGAAAQTLPLTHLDGEKILAQLISVAGEERPQGIEAPQL
ncbi:hypothetical protein CI109_103389 [Kwoniella shandongensis]|uniref:Uncharacterized protein n=1 Tax=Kwoniella shandongensis TaxID=1734106 RepID=A0A5M6BWC3_9TREE|nr:uncharacterized protein CI109_004470 [Kwoniella shandongensis]KAA5527178.1 hypothetical protein CI109_004470 [Kwoniella shandongensis]